MNWFNLRKPKSYISETFAEKAADPKAKPKKRPAPISVRVSAEERAQLEKDAAGMSMNAHIRARLFSEDATPKRKRRNKSPVKDHAALARVLSALGQCNLARDLGDLSAAMQDNKMCLTPESERLFQHACQAVILMRRDLVKALGLKP